MPKNVTHISALVASPSDVAEERDLLEDVVRELNDTSFAAIEVHLDLARWETRAYPSAGPDPQFVLNEQLGDNYDIFIGILWHRFGTPTPRAESGTAEEFERAYSRYLGDPNSVAIMFYFKEAAVPFEHIDPIQFNKVIEFRARLGKEGVLYWRFKDREELARYLRMHLFRLVNDLQERSLRRGPTTSVAGEIGLDSHNDFTLPKEEVEEGFLELLEASEERSEILSRIMQRMTVIIQGLGDRISGSGEEISAAAAAGGPNIRQNVKSITNRAAAELEHFAVGIEAEVPLYAKEQSMAMDVYMRLAEVQRDFSTEQVENFLGQIRGLRESMVTTREQIAGFRDSIVAVPRLTTAFNHAKRRAAAAVDSFLQELDKGIGLLGEIEKI